MRSGAEVIRALSGGKDETTERMVLIETYSVEQI